MNIPSGSRKLIGRYDNEKKVWIYGYWNKSRFVIVVTLPWNIAA